MISEPAGLDWITCLRAPAIQALARRMGRCSCRCSTSATWPRSLRPTFPGERLIVCRNRDLAAERARKREALLVATERELARIQAQVPRKDARCAAPPRSAWRSAQCSTQEDGQALRPRDPRRPSSWQRRVDQIAEEARLDGIYVIRTSVPAEHLDAAETVQAYKDLSRVERAFRSMKTVDLEIRPIRHWTADRACARMSSSACSPTMSSGICGRPWRRSCSTTPTSPPPGQSGLRRSRDRAFRRRQDQEGDQALGRWPASHELRRPHRASRHIVRNTMRVPLRPKHRFTLYSSRPPFRRPPSGCSSSTPCVSSNRNASRRNDQAASTTCVIYG